MEERREGKKGGRKEGIYMTHSSDTFHDWISDSYVILFPVYPVYIKPGVP